MNNGQIKSLAFSSEAKGEADKRHNFYICTDKQICQRQRCASVGVWGVPTYKKGNDMKKDKVLYICSRKYKPSVECSEWYESFTSALSKDVTMENNRIETPYAIIDFVLRKPLFTYKYDFVFSDNKEDDDVLLFAIGIGKDY